MILDTHDSGIKGAWTRDGDEVLQVTIEVS